MGTRNIPSAGGSSSQDTVPWVMSLGCHPSPPSPGSHVQHGMFWPDPVAVVDDCWWEAWVSPDILGLTQYVISDGQGGAHALLWGLDGSGAVTGNMWTGTTTRGFTGLAQDAVAAGEWVHLAVGYERFITGAIVAYVNGIMTTYSPWAGPRWSADFTSYTAGPLMVGGSDHLNWNGRIATILGYDFNRFPRNPYGTAQAFVPVRGLEMTRSSSGVEGGSTVSKTWYPDFACSYMQPPGTPMIPDLSFNAWPECASGSSCRCAGTRWI